MSAAEKTYRIYCFDGSRHIVSADWLKAADDAEAIARARAQGFGSKGELWDGERLVAQLDAVQQRA